MNRCARCSGAIPVFVVFCPHCSQAHEPDFDQLINLTIDGRYRIYRRLGRGGLSTIFAATDIESDRVVAIKISDPAQLVRRELSYAIDAKQARDYWDEMLERMRREAETLARIDHPNIVRFYGTGLINDELRYVAMEFLRGRTLREEIDRSGAIKPTRAVGVALEIASALAEAHSRGIVHRDINPRNIMIVDCELRIADCSESGADAGDFQSAIGNRQSAIEESATRNPQSAIKGSAIKLIDFGIAKFPQPPGAPPFTRHSTLAGTVAYASPEQCAGHPVDHRSDIYSLGVALYEMVTGERPFTGRTPTEVALKQIQSEPKPPRSINPAISIGLERAILRALAKRPDERQQGVEDLAGELRQLSNQIIIPLSGPTSDQAAPALSGNGIEFADKNDEIAESRLQAVRRRRRLVVAAAAMFIVALVSALLFARDPFSSKSEAPDLAPEAAEGQPAHAVIGSDADSLELDASRPSRTSSAATALSGAGVQMTPAAGQQAQTANSTGANMAAGDRAAMRTARSPRPSPVPSPIPPRAKPQMPPLPSPDIAIVRAPHPASEPDISQAPRRERDDEFWRREEDSSRGPNGNVNPDPERNDESGRIGPKLIQWSGRVNREREITIELPGVPGVVEIPRAYRDRVGVVEPPSVNNRWRCAVLRVFGRGGVSIVIRWWPAARNVTLDTARR